MGERPGWRATAARGVAGGLACRREPVLRVDRRLDGLTGPVAEPELSLWDMAALAPIVVEAGGRFTGLDGVPGVQQGNAAASNGLLHDALLAALRLPSP